MGAGRWLCSPGPAHWGSRESGTRHSGDCGLPGAWAKGGKSHLLPASGHAISRWLLPLHANPASGLQAVSLSASLERELPQCTDGSDGGGGEGMSGPGLGAEQLEGGWQGLGVHWSSTGGCPTYLTAAGIPRSCFVPCRSPGAHRASWKAGVCKLGAGLALRREVGLSYGTSWRNRQGFWAGDWEFSGYCRAIFRIQCLVPCLTDQSCQHEFRHHHLYFNLLQKLDPFLPIPAVCRWRHQLQSQ